MSTRSTPAQHTAELLIPHTADLLMAACAGAGLERAICGKTTRYFDLGTSIRDLDELLIRLGCEAGDEPAIPRPRRGS